jgi:hypothetical protein
MMRRTMLVLVATCCFGYSLAAAALSIEKPDKQKIFYGSAAAFEKAGEVDFKAVVKATPEYLSIKKKKIEVGSAKYWILVTEASNRALKIIREEGKKTKFDLIVAKGYLGPLKIKVEDITPLVLKKLKVK